MVYLSLAGKNLALTICALILILIFLVMLMNNDYELYKKNLELKVFDSKISSILSSRPVFYRDIRDKKIITSREEPITMHNNNFEEKLEDNELKVDEFYFDKPKYVKDHLPLKITGIVISYSIVLALLIFSIILNASSSIKESLMTSEFSKFIANFIGCYEFLSCSIVIILALLALDVFSYFKELAFYNRAVELAHIKNEEILASLGDTNIIYRN